jgi:hypothetical protein
MVNGSQKQVPQEKTRQKLYYVLLPCLRHYLASVSTVQFTVLCKSRIATATSHLVAKGKDRNSPLDREVVRPHSKKARVMGDSVTDIFGKHHLL